MHAPARWLIRTIAITLVLLFAPTISADGDSRLRPLPPAIHNTVPDLMLSLRSPYKETRRVAAYLLGEKGKPAGVAGPRLVELLGSSNSYVYREARKALVKLWPHLDDGTRGTLLTAMRNPIDARHDHAIWIITRLGPAVEPYRADLMELLRKKKGRELSDFVLDLNRIATRPEHLRPILNLFEEGDPWVRGFAVIKFAKAPKHLREALAPELLRLMRTGSPRHREMVMAYASLKNVDAKPFGAELSKGLDDPSTSIQHQAMAALLKLPNQVRARESRVRTLFRERKFARTRVAALEALARAGLLKTEELIQATEDRQKLVRNYAVALLLDRKKVPAEVLLRLLASPDWAIVRWTRDRLVKELRSSRKPPIHGPALFKIAGKRNCVAVRLIAVMGAYHGSDSIRGAVSTLRRLTRENLCYIDTSLALAQLGKSAFPILRETLIVKGREGEIASFTLRGMDNEVAVPFILKLLRDKRDLVRRAAARILHERASEARGSPGGAPRAVIVKALNKALGDSDASTRAYAVETLTDMDPGDMPAAKRIRTLRELMANSNRRARTRAFIAAGRMGAKAKPLLPLITNGLEKPGTRIAALQALERMGTNARSALPRLMRMIREEKKVETLSALAGVLPALDPGGETVTPALARIARGKPSDATNSALKALRELGPGARKALPFYRERLASKERYDRDEILRNLVSLGPEARTLHREVLALLKPSSSSDEQVQALRALNVMYTRGPLPRRVLRASANVYETSNYMVRGDALQLLLKHRGREIIPVFLWAHLGRKGVYLDERVPAMRRLGEFSVGDAGLTRILEMFARRPGPYNRIHSAIAMAGAGRPGFAEKLLASARPGPTTMGDAGRIKLRKLEALPFIYSPRRTAEKLHRLLTDPSQPDAAPRDPSDILRTWVLHFPDLPAAQSTLRRWMTDPKKDKYDQFRAARILLHPRSVHRMAALRRILALARKDRHGNREACLLLGEAGADARFALPYLRRTAARHGKRDIRVAARRAVFQIESASRAR